MKAKSTYVLVHGGNMSTDTWNKLAKSNDYPPGGILGGKIWDSIIPSLKAHNHRVFAPTLKDEHISNLTDHIEQICNLITENNLKDVILVGHSYGGMIITVVAAKIPERIRRLVYVDAALPDPGQSLFDIIASGGRAPMSFAGLEPAAPYVEKLQFDAEKIKTCLKRTFSAHKANLLQLLMSPRKKLQLMEEWAYFELPTSHVLMASMPEQFLQLLLKTAEK